MKIASICFILFHTLNALADENQLKSIYELVLSRKYDDAYERIRTSEIKGNIPYKDSFGNELTKPKEEVVEAVKEIERTDKKCSRILTTNYIELLKSEAKKCQGLVADSATASEQEEFCSEHRSKYSEAEKCGNNGPMEDILKDTASTLGLNYTGFLEKYNSRLDDLNTYQKSLNVQSEKILADKKEAEKKNLAEEEKLKATPRYKKCQYLSRTYSDKKMLNLWNKNIDAIKSDTKTAGMMTVKMQAEMDKSLSFVRVYKQKISDGEKQLNTLSNISIAESECKKLIPDFGASDADRYNQ